MRTVGQIVSDNIKRILPGIDKASSTDAVEHPEHYNSGTLNIETIDVIRNAMTPDEYEGYLLGNILKYLHRYKHKGDECQDLMKAQWYLDRLIKMHKER